MFSRRLLHARGAASKRGSGMQPTDSVTTPACLVLLMGSTRYSLPGLCRSLPVCVCVCVCVCVESWTVGGGHSMVMQTQQPFSGVVLRALPCGTECTGKKGGTLPSSHGCRPCVCRRCVCNGAHAARTLLPRVIRDGRVNHLLRACPGQTRWGVHGGCLGGCVRPEARQHRRGKQSA